SLHLPQFLLQPSVLLQLLDGNAGLLNSNLGLHTGMEGENITVTCSFSVSGHRKFFCREKCEEGNILIETTEDAAENGRYSIKYEDKPFPSDNYLHVSIKQLKKSDSGWYRCALDRSFLPSSSWDFEIAVKEGEFLSFFLCF
uniref:Immunoglobulin domain-containing protein n=1 Tax=Amphiprion percula TaxID=161767 RepID=A0A3P8U080_AMPPE